MSAADEAARAESERRFPDWQNQYMQGEWETVSEADRRREFVEAAAWQRSQPIEPTDAMVEAAWRAWSNAPFPSKASLTKARAALTAALNTMKEPNR